MHSCAVNILAALRSAGPDLRTWIVVLNDASPCDRHALEITRVGLSTTSTPDVENDLLACRAVRLMTQLLGGLLASLG